MRKHRASQSKSRMNVFQDWMKLKAHPHSMIMDYGNMGCQFLSGGDTKLERFLVKNQHTQRKNF